MKFSKFGDKFTRHSGILQLMDDLGNALNSREPVQMLGGGNPAKIEAVNDVLQAQFQQLASSKQGIDCMGNYANPQGDQAFINALVTLLRDEHGLDISAANIALTNGSQNAFFYLFNLFSGEFSDGTYKNILFPLVPEYVGYSDVHIDEAHFSAVKPKIEETTHDGQSGFFKYHVDFDALANHADLQAGKVGAICCSRPTNPSGNVLTNEEMDRLKALAKQYNVALIIDNAYGLPFPNIIHTDASLDWDEDCVLCLSLSKVGMPGVRTGIVVANAQIIRALSAMNAIVNLAPTRFGGALTTPLIENGELQRLSHDVIQPFYQQKARFAIALIKEQLADYPVYIHEPEGAIFLWIWFKGLPVTSTQLYATLKEQGTIIIPGEHFFPGIDTAEYTHAHECIRISIAAEDDMLRQGIAKLGAVVRRFYDQRGD